MFKRVSEFLKDEAVGRTFNYYFLFICLGLAIGIGGPTPPALAEQDRHPGGTNGLMFMLGSIGYTLWHAALAGASSTVCAAIRCWACRS